MLHKIFFDGNSIVNEILKGIISREKAQCNSFLQPIEAEIERLEDIEKQVQSRLEVVKQLHRWVSEVFDLPKTNKTDSPGKPEDTKKPEETEQAASASAPEPAPKPADQLVPDPKPKRKQKKKANPGYKRLPKHRATGNPRLDALEAALHDALERLNNTKLAFYVTDIKEVRNALEELYKSWDKPEEERFSELEVGLKTAADKLSANSRASKSKVMQNIWSDIIVALQNKGNNE